MKPQPQNYVLVTSTLNPGPYTGYVRGLHVARLRVEDQVSGHHNPCTLNPTAENLNLTTETLNPTAEILNPKLEALNPVPKNRFAVMMD